VFPGRYALDVADFQIQSQQQDFPGMSGQASFIYFQAVLRRQLLVLITVGRANGLATNFLQQQGKIR
jgi:hypothetical protein